MALSLPANATPDAVPSEAYVLRDGGWVDAPCQVGVAFPPTRRAAAERGQLAFLLQSADARPLVDELCQSVANALEQTYYGESGSITRALREALLAANQTLFEHNVRADTAARLLLGIGCVVVRGSDLYMARLGPACVWTFSEGALAQFPTDSLWYALGSEAAGDVDNEPPAGMRLDVEPELGHSDAPAQSLVVLLSQSLKHRAQPATLLRALNGDDPAETRRHLQSITQGQDLAMLALAPVGDDADAEPMQGQGEPQGATALQAPSPTPVAAPVAPASASAAAAESATAIGPATLAEERALEQEVAQFPGPSDDHPAQPIEPKSAPEPLNEPEWDDDAWGDEDFEDDLDEPAPPLHREHIDLTERAESVARGAGRVVQSGAQRLRDGAEEALLKVLPDRLPERPEPEPARMPAISPASQSLVIIALLLPLLVLFTVIMVRVQHSREVDARRGSIRQTALSEYDQALRASSPQLQADSLQRTVELVEAGLAILPEDEVLVDLRRRATLKQDELDQVTRLYHFKRLDSYTVGGTALNEPSRIAIHDKDALVLNKGAGQVHGYTLSDVGDAVSSRAETQVLLRTGEKRGAIDVAELVDMAWLAPTGSRTTGEFVVLDREGTLWALRNGSFEAAPVADSDSWLKPVAIGAYMGNLYVLDPLGGRILKYLPSNNAYTTPPFPYLSTTVTVDMLGAVDMAIDGNVYVLFADGTIHKFFDGEEKPFPMTGLPTGMRNPTSIFVSGAQEPQAEGWVYVTDRGNERIVQFDKEGNYIRSFKANTSEPYMTALGGLFVDETTQRMFMFSERQFTLVALPPLPGR